MGEKVVWQEWGLWVMRPLHVISCAFWACSNLILLTLLPFDNVILCTPSFMAWWLRQHPVHDGQVRSHGNLVVHGEVFSVY